MVPQLAIAIAIAIAFLLDHCASAASAACALAAAASAASAVADDDDEARAAVGDAEAAAAGLAAAVVVDACCSQDAAAVNKHKSKMSTRCERDRRTNLTHGKSFAVHINRRSHLLMRQQHTSPLSALSTQNDNERFHVKWQRNTK